VARQSRGHPPLDFVDGERRAGIAEPIEDVAHEQLHLDPAGHGRHRFDHHGAAAAERFDLESRRRELVGHAVQFLSMGRGQLQRLRHQQALPGHRPLTELAPERLVQHALVGHMLVNHQQFIGTDRHNEALPPLAQHPPPAGFRRRGTGHRRRHGLGAAVGR